MNATSWGIIFPYEKSLKLHNKVPISTDGWPTCLEQKFPLNSWHQTLLALGLRAKRQLWLMFQNLKFGNGPFL